MDAEELAGWVAFLVVPVPVFVFPLVDDDFTTVVPFDVLDAVVLALTCRLCCVRVAGRDGGGLRGLLDVVGADTVELVVGP